MPTPLDFARQELASRIKEPEAFARYSGGRDEAWCAHFVSWLYAQAGAPLPGYFPPHTGRGGFSPTGGCNYLVKTMRDAGRILPPGTIPQPNDLIFYKHVDPKTGQFTTKGALYGLPFVYGHVGLVADVIEDRGVKKVVTIEGNYSSKVSEVKTRLDSPTIGLFARPAGPGEAQNLPVAPGAGTSPSLQTSAFNEPPSEESLLPVFILAGAVAAGVYLIKRKRRLRRLQGR